VSHEVESMFSGQRIIPWHKLGTIVDGVLTAEEAIKAAGLDWAVRKIPMFVPSVDRPQEETVYIKVDGKYVATDRYHMVDEVPDKFAIQRVTDSSVLGGWMGTDYVEFQNVEAFDLFDTIVSDDSAKYETAGALFGGKVVFILARLNRDITIGGDPTIPYMLLTTSHDGSSALRMMATPVRVVCANTLRMALGNHKSDWSTRHTTNVRTRVAEARDALQIGWAYYDAFEAEVNTLMNQPITNGDVDILLGKVFPKKGTDVLHQKALAVRGLYESSPTIGEFKNTAWGLLNSVNEWELWTQNMRDESKRVERQARDIVSGLAMPATKKAHELLVAAR
jgi:phage/plasmid-like protein (TIGR03299 family)